MLFRAYVYSRHPTPISEAAVFFESPCHSQAALRLVQVVSAVWGCAESAVQFYNLFGESELRQRGDQRCFERGADADTVLLENGFGPEGASFTPAERTALLVGPRWHARLLAAQKVVAERTELRAIELAIKQHGDKVTASMFGDLAGVQA